MYTNNKCENKKNEYIFIILSEKIKHIVINSIKHV